MSDLDTAALGLVTVAVLTTAVLVALHRLGRRRRQPGSVSPATRRKGP